MPQKTLKKPFEKNLKKPLSCSKCKGKGYHPNPEDEDSSIFCTQCNGTGESDKPAEINPRTNLHVMPSPATAITMSPHDEAIMVLNEAKDMFADDCEEVVVIIRRKDGNIAYHSNLFVEGQFFLVERYKNMMFAAQFKNIEKPEPPRCS